MSEHRFSLRQAIAAGGALLAARPRLPPLGELVLTSEFEESAKLVLPPEIHAQIARGGREGFDRITFRPRAMTPTSDLDLSLELFGEKLFSPIWVGPNREQKRFHPEGEVATAFGASAAQALMVVNSRSSVPIEAIAAAAKVPLWYEPHLGPGAEADVRRAARAGCKAVCVSTESLPRPIDWAAIQRLWKAADVPVLVNGIATPDEALLAIRHGAQGIVLSPHAGSGANTDPILLLPPVVDAVDGKVPVIFAGGVELGADALKALAYGAKAVLVANPTMWGLASYGSEGVRAVIEMIQCDLGRTMAACGRPTLASIDRGILRLHSL
jgi:4-hydroxymandelate oxidase